MRYSVVEKRSEFGIMPVPSLMAIGDGDDIKLTQGDLTNYALVGTDADGVRVYRTYRTTLTDFTMLFIPETHQYFNSGLLIANFPKGNYPSFKVAKKLHDICTNITDKY